MPFILGGIVAVCARFGYHPTGVQLTEIVGIIGTVLTIVVRPLEAKWPAFGILLGYIGAPVYAPSTKVSQSTQIAQLEAKVAVLLAEKEEAASPSPVVAAAASPPDVGGPVGA
jgi:hypothetical protein